MVQFTFPITPAERESLLKLGLIVESVAGMPDLTMTEVISSLLSPESTVNLTQLLDIRNAELDEALPSVALRRVALSFLKTQVLDTAPHDRNGTLDWKVMTAITALALLAVTLRLVSRRQSRSRLAAEEWLIAFSMAIVIAYALTTGLGYGFVGAGSHIWDISFNLFKRNLLLVYVAELTYSFAIFFVRSSLLVFYYGLSHFRRFHIGILIVFGINLVLMVTRIFFNAFSCRPFNFWEHPIERTCINNSSEWLIAFGSLNVVVDCVVLLLPMPVVWKLPLTIKERFIVLGIFSVGTMAMVGSITRIFTLRPFLRTVDRTHEEVPLGVWSLVELDLGIIATCIPALRHLFKSWWPHARQSSSSTSSRSNKFRFGKGSVGSSAATGTTATANTNTTRSYGGGTVTNSESVNLARNIPIFGGQGNDGRDYGNVAGSRGEGQVEPRPPSASESQIGIATTTFDEYSQFEMDEFIDDRASDKAKEDLEQGLGGGGGTAPAAARQEGDHASDSGSAVASSGIGPDDGLDPSQESLESDIPGQWHQRDEEIGLPHELRS